MPARSDRLPPTPRPDVPRLTATQTQRCILRARISHASTRHRPARSLRFLAMPLDAVRGPHPRWGRWRGRRRRTSDDLQSLGNNLLQEDLDDRLVHIVGICSSRFGVGITRPEHALPMVVHMRGSLLATRSSEVGGGVAPSSSRCGSKGTRVASKLAISPGLHATAVAARRRQHVLRGGVLCAQFRGRGSEEKWR